MKLCIKYEVFSFSGFGDIVEGMPNYNTVEGMLNFLWVT